MALKHLKNALELLNAGMTIADIRGIIALKDEPEQDTEASGNADSPDDNGTNEPEQAEETQDEPEQAEETQDEPEQEEKQGGKPVKKNPYQEKAENNSSPDNLVKQLNQLF